MIRRALAAAVLLSATACVCSYWRADACVVDARSCTTTGMEISWCPEEPEPAALPARDDRGEGSWCPVGVLHEGQDCADLGFTSRCPDGTWVRPRTGC